MKLYSLTVNHSSCSWVLTSWNNYSLRINRQKINISFGDFLSVLFPPPVFAGERIQVSRR